MKRMEKTMKNVKHWWRVPLLLLACLIGGSSPTWAVMHFKDNTRMSVFHEPTETEPFIGVSVLYYDANDCDSYFTHKKTEGGNPGPAVYVDGKYICSPDNELAWPGGKAEGSEEGNWSGAESACGKDGWYGNTYEHDYCTIRFWNPYHEAKKGNEGYYRTYIEMRIYLKNWNTAQTHTVKIKGWWRLNCNKGEGYEEKVFSNIKGFEDWKNTSITALTTGKSSVTVSGSNLGSKSTNVALYASFGSAPSEYKDVADGCFSKNSNYTTSFSNMTCSVDRNNYKNTLNLPVQLSRTITTGDVSGDMHIYRWFTPNVPGFVYPVEVKCSEPNQWTRKTTLTWTVDAANNRCTEGKWAVRNNTTGEVLSQNVLTYEKRSYEATIDGYNKTNTFEVYFVPTDVSSLPSELKASTSISIKPSFSLKIAATDTLTNKISLSWTHTAFGDASPTNKYSVILERSLDESNWSEIARFEIVNDTTKGAYDDTNVENMTTYYYRVKTTAMDQMFISSTVNGVLAGITTIKSFTASRGMFSSMVKLKWEANQIGTSTTYFTIKRRLLDNSSNNVWSEIYSTSGTGAVYSYDDVTAMPGDFYEYSVTPSLLKNDGNIVYGKNVITDGYSRSSGNVSGRITYGTGTAVKNVKVVLTPNDETAGLRCLKLEGAGSGFSCNTTKEDIQNKLFKEDFSIQMYINPNSSVMSDSMRYIVLDVNQIFHIGLDYEPSTDRYKLGAWIAGRGATELSIPANQWSHVTVVHKHATGTTTFYVPVADTLQSAQVHTIPTDSDPTIHVWTNKPIVWNNVSLRTANLAIGNYGSLSAPQNNNYCGCIDEFRFFTKALTEEEILRDYNHTLVGNEPGLAIYYPFDEGIYGQTMAYDFSKTGGVPNGRHARANVSAISSSFTPSSEQLSLMAYTDSVGSYEVNGVPFSGEGISYIITPQLGIHEFSPAYKTAYVSSSSLVHSGVDFEDVSSFPVSGHIYYDKTDYPVEGVSFYVDGNICSKDGAQVLSNAQGEYTISVPIGDHFIKVVKDGHVFKDSGRYPADPDSVGVRMTFDRKIDFLDFQDQTLVNFTGRVVGGDIQGSLPVGFEQSKNNIGVAKLELKPNSDDIYRLNVIKPKVGTTYNYIANPDSLPVKSATSKIRSTSWRGGGDFCNRIYIHTDPETGEFSAMLPPLEYTIAPIKLVNKDTIIAASTSIDLTNPKVVYSDTLYTKDGDYTLYEYNTILRQTIHSAPSFTVTQIERNDGSFGIDSIKVTDEIGSFDIKDIYSVADNGAVSYKYGAPLFIKGDPYTFVLHGYEEYVNVDNKERDQVPLEGTIITVSNALSADQGVYFEGSEAGQVAELKPNEIRLDSLGYATYKWRAGLPNITYPYKRTIAFDYEVGDRHYQWGNGMEGIILGELPTGNNFVTAGPDHPLMVLRDPPGSNSFAEWTSGSSTTLSKVKGATFTENFSSTFKHKFGTDYYAFFGVGVGTINLLTVDDELEVGIKMESGGENSTTKRTTITTTKTISTSAAPEYVGAQGDVFVGNATNIIFGKARNVGFKRTTGDNAEITLEDIISTGLEFSTMFLYTQNYIENVMFPNYELMRKNLLQTVDQSFIDNYENNTDHWTYFTTLRSDNEEFGKAGTYTAFKPKPENLKDSLAVDTVNWINTQIDNWKSFLEENERAKVRAFASRDQYLKQGNISFDAGSTYTYSYETEKETTSTWDWTVSAGIVAKNTAGLNLNGFGFEIELEDETTGGTHEVEEEGKTTKTAFAYTLAEDGDDDALTVDVLDYDNYGPIFRTRGGQTCCPYEGKVVTKYYQPGTTIMEATMQIEVPDIEVKGNSSMSDIPTGGSAYFTLELTNKSEIDEDVYYRLLVPDESNPDGALISIDGKVISDSRVIKIPAGQTVTKTLQLKQTNTSILEYENIAVVLASQCQFDPTSTWDVISDTVYISARFVPSSSDVQLALSNTTMNTLTGSNLGLTFSGFDRNYHNLKAFRLQYKKQGSNDWTQLMEYVTDSTAVTNNNLLLPENGYSVTYTLPMENYSDGNYLFRVVSVASYGNGEVYRYSEELALVKDMQRPRPLGQPEPTDGVLDIGDELSVTFNENILKGELTDVKNFYVTGVLNGAEVAHETALSLQGNETTAQTEAGINLANKDFSIDAWVRLSGEGTILSHGQGAQKLTVGTDSNNKLVVDIAGKTYTSSNSIPTGKWSFLTLNYQNVGENGILNASVAYDAATDSLFDNRPAVVYSGNGPLAVGTGQSSMNNGQATAIHELLLWDEAHDIVTALANRSKTKSPSTRHLIGYWKMNEGEGKTIRDYARSRNMTMADETWYLNNVNKAIELNGSNNYLSINTAALPNNDKYNDYALEFWMRGDQQTGEAQLLQMGDISLWVNANGMLQLTSNGETWQVGSASLTDNAWHHIALNVLRLGSAAVYVDGVRQLTIAANNIGSIASYELVLGARNDNDSYGYLFKGQMDEVRVWNATLNADQLLANRKVRLTGNEAGLSVYYPFEKTVINDYNQLETVGVCEDLTDTKAEPLNSVSSFTDDAPALRTKPTETNVKFNFTASDNKIVIELDEEENAAALEGCTINFTVRDVRDENGNYSEPAIWSAFINRKELTWADDALSVELPVETSKSLTATIVNKGGKQQMWTLEGMPSWLTASSEYGTTNPRSESQVTFTVSPATPIGKYEETVYLKGNNGIETPLTIKVKVTGDEPLWSVNVGDYEETMDVIANLFLLDQMSEDEDDLVGAFIDGVCRGVAHPVYEQDYDSYFVTMDIYGNSGDKNKQIEFKAYDASTGIIYPVVKHYKYNETTATEMVFQSNNLNGRFATPLKLAATDEVEQNIDLIKGWNWISFGVKPETFNVETVFSKANGMVVFAQNFNGNSSEFDGSEWIGRPWTMTNLDMYTIQTSDALTLNVTGHRVKSSEELINLNTDWNWVAFNSLSVMSLDEALAGMSPIEDEIIKGQRGVAYYENGKWYGNLKQLTPGKGYKIQSKQARPFAYPTKTATAAGSRRAMPMADGQMVSAQFTPVDYHNYPGNMVLIAQLVLDGSPVEGVELGIFAGDECREAAVSDERGMIVITIPGSESCELTFRVATDDDQWSMLNAHITYANDAVVGAPKTPFILDLGEATGVMDIYRDAMSNGDIYDLQGRKVQLNDKSRKLRKGVYVINGQKKVK